MIDTDRKLIEPKIWKPSKEYGWIDPDFVVKNPRLWEMEKERCKRDPWYFIIRWCKTIDNMDEGQHVKRFPPFTYLKYVVDYCLKNNKVLLSKSRRLTMTWLILCLYVHQAIFKNYQNIFMQSKNKDDSKALIRKVHHILQYLPDFILSTDDYEPLVNQVFIKTSQSYIFGVSSGADKMRMHTVNGLFFDEAAFNDVFIETLTGALPTLEGGGRIICISSIKLSSFYFMMEDDDARTKLKDAYPEPIKTEPMFGMCEWFNPGNKYHCIQVHYNAHPFKDQRTEIGKEWYEREKTGYLDELWLQEYEIDARVLGISQIYPEFDYDKHVRFDLDIDDIKPNWTVYMSCDPGIDVPTACLWAAVDEENNVYVFDEYYEKNRTVEQNAQAILEKEGFHPFNEYDINGVLINKYEPYLRVIDPAADKRNTLGSTTLEAYAESGICFITGKNDVNDGIANVKEYMSHSGKFGKLFFLGHLVNTFNEFKKYEWKNGKPKKKNDHLMDALKYLLALHPVYIDPSKGSRYIYVHDKLTGITRSFIDDEFEDDEELTNPWEESTVWI